MDYVKSTCPYKVVAGHKIQADIYLCPGKSPRPAVMWIHGGALIFGERGLLSSDQLERYLNSGYAVVSIDYRLAPETKLPAIIEDLQDAFNWIVDEGPRRFNIDPGRIAVAGHSAGGFLTLMSGLLSSLKPKALVSFYGYGSLSGAWYAQPDPFYNTMPAISKEVANGSVGNTTISKSSESDGRDQFYLYCRQQGIWLAMVAGLDPEKEREWYVPYEALPNVTADYPPTLLLHGEKDTDVPFEQSVLMSEALSRHNVPHRFITNPNWEHGFDKAGMADRTVREAFDEVLLFLEKHLK